MSESLVHTIEKYQLPTGVGTGHWHYSAVGSRQWVLALLGSGQSPVGTGTTRQWAVASGYWHYSAVGSRQCAGHSGGQCLEGGPRQ